MITTSTVRACACGKSFIPPSIAPRATRCRGCHLEHRATQKVLGEKAAQKGAALRKIEEKRKADEEIRAMLKEMYKTRTLPKHAKVNDLGTQVVVAWGGLSATFHTA